MTADEHTVLVVDDERDLADLYATWLSDEFRVLTAYSGEAALEAVDETVDIVLLDRRMPDRSGSEVLAELRERGIDCQVVMVTAVDPDFDIIEMGFDDYLVKPIDREGLHATAERLVTRATYDDRVQEYFSLQSKRVVLEAEKTEAELRESEAYAGLVERIADLEEALDDLIAGFDDRDFTAALTRIGGDLDDELVFEAGTDDGANGENG